MEHPQVTHDPIQTASPGCILLTYRGSVAHGTYLPPEDVSGIDDVDFIGVTVAPTQHYFGLTSWGDRATRTVEKGNIDLVEYEIKKFVTLSLNCNPNLLSALWCSEEHVIKSTNAGQHLRTLRHLFLSKKAYDAFSGYAHGQLKKMAALAFEGYMGEKRKELVKKFGFDTKNAAHCIRIFRMGCELLETGEINVNRTDIDANELIAIKHGEWSFEKIKAEAALLEERAKKALEKTELPDAPNFKEVEDSLISILKGYFSNPTFKVLEQ